ncbi:hypothetical protein Tco_1445052, partial [Tanacetum coccineum]
MAAMVSRGVLDAEGQLIAGKL